MALATRGEGVKHFMDKLTSYWWNTTKEDYLNILFPEWIAGDPANYYHDKWMLFSQSPMKAYMGLDDYRRKVLIEVIEGERY